jgi:hypothetical protein
VLMVADPNLPPWANGILSIIGALGGTAGILGLIIGLKAMFKSGKVEAAVAVNAQNQTDTLDRMSARTNGIQAQVTDNARAIAPASITGLVGTPPPAPRSDAPRIQT